MLLFALACEVVSSEELTTDQVEPNFNITFYSDLSFIATAVLYQDDADLKITTVDLAAGDSLAVNVGGVDYPMGEMSLYDSSSGEQTMAGYGASGVYDATMTEAIFSLSRTSGESAPSSVVSIPPLFVMSGVEATWAMGVDLPISWTPTATLPMTVGTSSDCTLTEDELDETLASDAGSYTVTAGYLDYDSAAYPEGCSVTVSLSRKSTGTLDPVFAGGAIGADFYESADTIVQATQ